ncbi:MAG: glycosyltransferase family 2 protein [Candidatus Muiribacteriota bacterium]
MNPEVTVLMSVYNGEKYLRQCMDSVLNQIYHNFEFLIINDFSTDSSVEIINSYKDSRIRLIENQKNIGLTKSLNKGLKLAKGKYIARVDSDDYWEINKLKLQMKILKKDKVDILGTYANVIDEKNKVISDMKPEKNHNKILCGLLFKNQIIHSSVIFNKKKVLEMGGFNPYIKYAQDYELWLRCFEKGLNFKNIPLFLVNYRKHSDSISVKKNINQEQTVLNSLEKIYFDYFKVKVNKRFLKEYRGFLKKIYIKISFLRLIKFISNISFIHFIVLKNNKIFNRFYIYFMIQSLRAIKIGFSLVRKVF